VMNLSCISAAVDALAGGPLEHEPPQDAEFWRADIFPVRSISEHLLSPRERLR